jgi:small subunit ribosomal protein S6
MRSYELMTIYRPDLAETDVRAEAEQLETSIAAAGTVTETDFWGKRRFAYEIDHLTEGYYSVVGFDGDTDLIAALEHSLALSEAVIRHKITRRTDREG